jgi:hypothetical protein
MGSVMVNSGSRGLFTLCVESLVAGAVRLNVRPHTRQRVAFSIKRVPQVGHTLVFLGCFLGHIFLFTQTTGISGKLGLNHNQFTVNTGLNVL